MIIIVAMRALTDETAMQKDVRDFHDVVTARVMSNEAGKNPKQQMTCVGWILIVLISEYAAVMYERAVRMAAVISDVFLACGKISSSFPFFVWSISGV